MTIIDTAPTPAREIEDLPYLSRRLGISNDLTYRMAKSGAFKGIVFRIGARYRVSVPALDRSISNGMLPSA